MKRRISRGLILGCCAALISLAGMASAAEAQMKVATISIQKILGTSKAAQDGQKTLQAEADKFQAKFKADEDALTAMKNEIEKKGSVWSSEVRAEKEREYQKRFRDYSVKADDAKAEMAQLEKKLMEPVLKQLHEIIADYGKKNGYTLILENTMKGLRNRTGLIYADDSLDISEQIQKELDARMKK
ncbi:MAG: OmpH family outer membrane protein [Thermodesulfobacteriota bacterium]